MSEDDSLSVLKKLNEERDKMLKRHIAACTQDVATMAAYEELGVHPAWAPRFAGWMPDRPGAMNIGTVNDRSSHSGGWWKVILAAIGGALLTGLIILACLLYRPSSSSPIKPQSFDVSIEGKEGDIKIDGVKPVP